jgi:hypothetical protein
MRKVGIENTTPKYLCCITFMGNEVHKKEYPSLKKLADDIDIPYHTITDVFEGRRSSFMKYKNRKYFPDISISKLSNININMQNQT